MPMNTSPTVDSDYHYSPAPISTAISVQPVPRQPSLDPISDAIRDHYLAQSRSADQVRRMSVMPEWTEPFDEDDGA